MEGQFKRTSGPARDQNHFLARAVRLGKISAGVGTKEGDFVCEECGRVDE